MTTDNDPKTLAERAGMKVIGPDATDDQVQEATDMADGKRDGLAAMPETDLGMALLEYEAGRFDKIDLLFLILRDMFAHGVRHEDSSDMTRLALVLGPEAVALIKKLVALV